MAWRLRSARTAPAGGCVPVSQNHPKGSSRPRDDFAHRLITIRRCARISRLSAQRLLLRGTGPGASFNRWSGHRSRSWVRQRVISSTLARCVPVELSGRIAAAQPCGGDPRPAPSVRLAAVLRCTRLRRARVTHGPTVTYLRAIITPWLAFAAILRRRVPNRPFWPWRISYPAALDDAASTL